MGDAEVAEAGAREEGTSDKVGVLGRVDVWGRVGVW